MENDNRPVNGQGPIIREDATPSSEAPKGGAGSQEGFLQKVAALVRACPLDPQGAIRAQSRMLNWVRDAVTPHHYDVITYQCVRFGHAGLLAAQILSVILGVAAAIKFSDWRFLLGGFGMALVLIILQFVASRFLHAGDNLVRASPSRLASADFLDCTALLAEAGGLFVLVAMLLRWELNPIVIGFAAWALGDAIMILALHPDMLNIRTGEDVSAGEEAMGILSFFVKSIVRVVPITFGVGAVLGAIALLVALCTLPRATDIESVVTAVRLLAAATALPFAAYLLFAFYHLLVDVVRAVLAVPQKLDGLKAKGTAHAAEEGHSKA